MARTKPAAKAEQKPTPEKLKRKLAELKKSTVVGEADEDSNSGGSETNSPDSEAVKQSRQGNGTIGRKSSQEQGKKDLKQQVKQDKTKDRWSSIEEGEIGLSAAEVFRSFDSQTPTTEAKVNGKASSRKQKRKKTSDGLDAPRIEVHNSKKQKIEEEKDEQSAHSAKAKDKSTARMEKDKDNTPQKSKSSLSQNEKVNGSSSRKGSLNIFKSLLESSPPAIASPNFTIATNSSPNADTAIYSSAMKKGRGSKQSHVTESPDGILVNSSASKPKQTPKGKNASVVNRTVLLSDDDGEEEKTEKMNKTKTEKSKADEIEMDEDSFSMQRRKGSAKKNRLRVDSSSNDDEEEEEEEEESDEDEDEDEIETDMDEDEESSDNRADAPIRNAIRKHFIDDEAEEVNVPIDEQDEELTSEDGFIVDDGEELMTTDDEDEDSDPTAVEGEEEMVTDESSDDDLMGEDRQPETVQGTLRMSFEPVNLDAFPFNVEDSLISANKTFAWLISPYDSQKFFNDVYQKTVLYVKRNNRKHYGNLFSAVSLAKILEEQYLEYTTNINVALYKDGKRTTLNGKGQAYANVVRDHIQNGCSIQLVNPQTFDDRIWYVCELLQELFGCFVGANTYLTPSGSAGFAPHWDDIDAFILQVEGRKHWTVYAPRNAQEELPLESSGNFLPSDLSGRRPVWQGWVETGDMLYVPRGFIHMAKTDPSTHSLHVTLSTGMHHSFADLLKHMMDDALDLLSEMRSKTRRGLPVGYLDMGGVAELPYSNEEQHIQKFVHPLYRHLRALRNMAAERMGDSAVDLMAREFFKTALPPRLTPAERERSALGVKTNLLNKKPLEWSMKNKVRIIRRHTQRLIYENEDTAFIIHRLSNSRIYEGRPETIVEFNIKWVPVFAALMCSYPEWVDLKELSQNEACKSLSKDDLMNAVLRLYTNGMLLVKWT